MAEVKNKKTVAKQPVKTKKAASANLPQKWYSSLYPLLVILPLVFIAYAPVLNNELTNWDDPDLIIDNPLIRSLSFDNIKAIFSAPYFGNYQPLHILAYAIQYHFWGLNPAGYHTVSLLLFLITVSLVYYFVYLIGKKRIILAAIATLLFAINAMHVESVAWAAEHKDMLYSLFYVAALIAYVKYILSYDIAGQKVKYKYLAFSFLLFVLSLFSKVMAVSIVGALVFLDFLYARRFTVMLILEKIPYVVLSVIVGLAQVKATAGSHTFDTSGTFDFADRILIACRNLMFFVYKMLLPVNLSAFHPYPSRLNGAPWPTEFYIAPVFVILLAAVFVWSFWKSRVLFFSIGFFVSALALVLQFVAIGPAMFNERYSLIPAIAMSFAIACGLDYLLTRYPGSKSIIFGATGLYLLYMFILTFARCDVWQTSLSLWDDALKQYPTAGMALNNRGKIYGKELGNTTKAMEDLSAAIASDPTYEQPYSNRGIIYCMNGRFDLAISDFNTALRIDPEYYEPLVNRAIAYAQLNKTDSALSDFNRCESLRPGNASLYLNRGLCYLQNSQFDLAVADFTKGISLNSNESGELYLRRSQAYYGATKYMEAYQDVMAAKSAGIRVEQSYYDKLLNLVKVK